MPLSFLRRPLGKEQRKTGLEPHMLPHGPLRWRWHATYALMKLGIVYGRLWDQCKRFCVYLFSRLSKVVLIQVILRPKLRNQ